MSRREQITVNKRVDPLFPLKEPLTGDEIKTSLTSHIPRRR